MFIIFVVFRLDLIQFNLHLRERLPLSGLSLPLLIRHLRVYQALSPLTTNGISVHLLDPHSEEGMIILLECAILEVVVVIVEFILIDIQAFHIDDTYLLVLDSIIFFLLFFGFLQLLLEALGLAGAILA
mmetsp:Transcript_20974/g.20088  ORF Transcript_20974/g.20088 Transcript_20974/m.20088 type:complete len:129 (-) Transcript_20974:1551-1937(-)